MKLLIIRQQAIYTGEMHYKCFSDGRLSGKKNTHPINFLNGFGREGTVCWSDLSVLSSIVLTSCRSLFESGQCNIYVCLKSLIILNLQSFISDPNDHRNRTQNIGRVLLHVKDQIRKDYLSEGKDLSSIFHG